MVVTHKNTILDCYAADEYNIYKSAIELVLKDGVFLVQGNTGSITCTSTNCPGAGCTPYQHAIAGGTVWSCTSCTNSCTKTATVTIKPKNASIE